MSYRPYRALVVAAATLLASSVANAQLFRAYVASTGNDANPCTLVAPCRLLPAALAAIADGGEIWMLDSANYNTSVVFINKSVSILAVPGAVGSILLVAGPSSDAIVVEAPGKRVSFRNLVLMPSPGVTGGAINVSRADRVMIDGCLIANFTGTAVSFAHSDGGGRLVVADSRLRDNGGGISVNNGAKVNVVRSVITGSGANGVSVGSIVGFSTQVWISGSTISGSEVTGVSISGADGTTARVTVQDSQISGNGFGVVVAGTGIATVTRSTLSDNANSGIRVNGPNARVHARGNTVTGSLTGFVNTAGVFESGGDNSLGNNSTPTSGTITLVGPQ